MIDEFFKRRPAVALKLKRSPFRQDFEELVTFLQARGHRPSALRAYLAGAAHLIHCLERGAVQLEGLTRDELRRFASRHSKACRCGRSYRVSRDFVAVAAHLFDVMRARHPLGDEDNLPTPAERLLEEFDAHLQAVRGLRQSTRERYARDLRSVLVAKFGAGAIDSSRLTVGDVRHWVTARASTCGARTTHAFVTALRSLFRFLAFRGDAAGALLSAVPAVRSYRLSDLPGGLDDAQLASLLDVIDRSSAIGLRTRAMVLCLAVLGLRAGDVAAVRIEDLDWRAGTLRLPAGKGRRISVLPLPPAVGRALAAYLKRGRPKTTDRHVFVRHYLPVGGALASRDVTHSIRRAMARAGLRLPSTGAHVLRHTAASRMIRAGAKIKEVADVLGHRDIDTTRIYTKVDWPRLAEVALPWPLEVA